MHEPVEVVLTPWAFGLLWILWDLDAGGRQQLRIGAHTFPVERSDDWPEGFRFNVRTVRVLVEEAVVLRLLGHLE